jgi:hypothetical protein
MIEAARVVKEARTVERVPESTPARRQIRRTRFLGLRPCRWLTRREWVRSPQFVSNRGRPGRANVAIDVLRAERGAAREAARREQALKILDGSATRYLPFAGLPSGHPTRLGGSA